MEMSDGVKSVEGSEREKAMEAVSPAEREEASEERAMEGGRVSIDRVRELSGLAPSVLKLPAESQKEEEITEIRPSVVLSAAGVKMAEYEEPEPEKAEREPPEMEMSDAVKSVEGSEREKERLATSPVLREVMSEEREILGGVVSAVVVSMERVRELSGSAPSVLRLPDESVNLELATEISPSAMLSAAGVKMAV